MAALIGLDATSSGFDPGLQDPPITFGVWGDSSDADGVIGSSNTGVGVFGRSIAAAAAAVRGSSQNGTGVQATSAGGSAVHARRDPGGGAAVTEAFLATPSLAADLRGDVATSGALRVGGRLGVGSTAPRAAVGIRGVSAAEELLSLEDSSGVTRWHVNQKLAGRSGLNFAETDVPDGNGRLYLQAGGNVGIGTTGPNAKLTVWTPSATGVQEGIRINNPVGFAGNGHGSSLVFSQDRSPGENNINATIEGVQEGADTSERAYLAFGTRSGVGAASTVSEKMRISSAGNVGIGTTAPRARLEVDGNIRAANIGLTNADCAEDFDICETEQVEPGTVMVVGEEGVLYPSRQAYDKRVAGVISGAGAYQPGIVLDKQQSGNIRKPIALFGKVYCKVNAQDGAIEVGDLLTTSPMPGHAMKADDPLQAFGAVIGKALRSLKEGQGLIPILIALQ